MTLTKANKAFYDKVKKVLKKWPDATSARISGVTGNTKGSTEWNIRVLKKARFVKRDKRGNLVAVK